MMIGRRVVLAIGVIVAFYVFSFACTFELFGDPVRSEDGQWLGPPKRINPTVTDIGKIYVYRSNQLFAYRFYRPLCVVWLRVMGFP
jgi:hypothetical protein